MYIPYFNAWFRILLKRTLPRGNSPVFTLQILTPFLAVGKHHVSDISVHYESVVWSLLLQVVINQSNGKSSSSSQRSLIGIQCDIVCLIDV